jgi:Cu/Ag efflux protein CusF
MKAILSILIILCFVGSVYAQTQPTKPAETKPTETKPAETKPAETKPAETKPAEKAVELKGTVDSVDTTAGKVTIKDKKGNTHEIFTDAKTVIKKAKAKVELTELTTGTNISAICRKEGEKLIAKTIKIIVKSTKKTEEKPAETKPAETKPEKIPETK